ncbi:hypothetical protein IH785_11060 [candidate division KSB1 bacterium]|nr:hypothetical protein [candidate division KSB1 bacterium]
MGKLHDYSIIITLQPFVHTGKKILTDQEYENYILIEKYQPYNLNYPEYVEQLDELKNYWMGTKKEIHLMFQGLSRYCDHYITHYTAEHESGWDMTSRFNERCLDYLPIDLNSCLYKYEIDLAETYNILNDKF